MPVAPLVGIVVVDKPPGLSSAQVVHRLRKILNEDRAGHTGTLDPLATGVLPICLNVATKLAGFLIAEDKRYWTQIQLGVATTTLDRVGDVVVQASDAAVAAISDGDIHQVLQTFLGPSAQVPPMYSAIKVDGMRLYKHARAGDVIERQPRDITVHSLHMLARHGATVELAVHCSKGTYIRSLVDDIGRALGVGAHVRELRRIASGRFSIAQAVPIERWTRDELQAGLISLETATGLPGIVLDPGLPSMIERVRNGETMLPDEMRIPEELRHGTHFQVLAQLAPDMAPQLLAIAHVATYRVRYARVFR